MVMTKAHNPQRKYSLTSRMHNLSIKHNIPSKTILLKKQTHTTIKNLTFSLPIIQQLNTQQITIITNHYHMTRMLWLARFMGWPELEVATPRGLWWVDEPYRSLEIAREALAW